jgi:steroid delta-isomerase-like uncharacterized protein
MSEANKAATRRFFERLSAGDLAVIDEVIADNFVDYEEMPGITPDKAGVRQFFSHARSAFPDFNVDVEDIVAEGDRVVARLTMTGTQRGEFMGIPATSRKVSLPVIDILRFANGKVVEHWGIMDSGLMMQQLGIAPAPGAH